MLLSMILLPAAAPRADARQATARGDAAAAAIGRAWAALAAGRITDAVRAADEALAADPLDHHAVTVKVEALSRRNAIAALDVYDAWVRRVRTEDAFLLRPVARTTLRDLAAGADRLLQVRALERLAQAGDRAAGDALSELSKSAGLRADLPRARGGDAAAARRLLAAGDVAAIPPQAFAEAIAAAGPEAAPRLIELLKSPVPPARSAAALALGKLQAASAIPALREMMAGDPMGRPYAAVALAQLGDAEAEAAVGTLLHSEVPDTRLLAARAYAGKGRGPWVDALVPLLGDPNGLTRIRAAELLTTTEPERARAVLEQGLSDPNPVVRADVARVFEETGLFTPPNDSPAEGNLTLLRRLLRDADPEVRLRAAGGIMRLTQAR